MARIGDRKGLRFDAVCYRRGSRIRTMAGLVLDGRGNGFLILCAAPEQGFGAARPGFLELLTTVRILNPVEDDPDPFERAGARVHK